MLRKAVFFIFLLSLMAGCATIKEMGKGFAGISTKALEDSRKEAVKKTFACDYKTCYAKVKDILVKQECYIYAEDPAKNMIAVYVSKLDTTAVGIFLTQVDATHTQVEVSSMSIYGKEFVSGRLFNAIDRFINPPKEEGKLDEKKE